MKPSERIKNIIWDYLPFGTGCNLSNPFEKAVLRYLDEEYEKNKPCEHEPNGDMLSNGCYECKKCKVMYVN